MKLLSNVRDGWSGDPVAMLMDARGIILEKGPFRAPGAAEIIDGHGSTLWPAYIDSHCHILPMGLDLLKLNLLEHQTQEAMLDALRDEAAKGDDGWILAVQYDQNRFESGEHLTRDQLDSISKTRPILIRHCNGHCSVANSAALAAAGVAESASDPPGGSYRRDASGRMDGVLLEATHEKLWSAVPKPDLQEMVEGIWRASDRMRGFHIETAHDMMTGRYDLEQEIEAYRIASEQGAVRTRLYVQWRDVFGPRGIGADRLREIGRSLNPERVKICGIKIFCDGAIGSSTAGIYGSYVGERAPGPVISRRAKETTHPGTSGQLNYSPKQLSRMIVTAAEAGFPVAVHAIGDYAVDLVLDGFEQTPNPRLHRLEHAMLLSDAQIERIARVGCWVTFQPEFLSAFGHAYRRQLGDERASKLKRINSVLGAGIRVALNSDAPIVAGNPETGIRNAVNRPEGFDASENIRDEQARLAYSAWGADIGGDTGLVGRLEVGEFADYRLEP